MINIVQKELEFNKNLTIEMIEEIVQEKNLNTKKINIVFQDYFIYLIEENISNSLLEYLIEMALNCRHMSESELKEEFGNELEILEYNEEFTIIKTSYGNDKVFKVFLDRKEDDEEYYE